MSKPPWFRGWLLAALAVLVAVAVGGAKAYEVDCASRSAEVRAELARFPRPVFAPQRVVYHITDDGGFFDRRHFSRLENLSRHVAAVGRDRIDIKVVLQGAGVSLLERAGHNAELRSRLDRLRLSGVTFEVCQNTMIERGIHLVDLAGVEPADLVAAALPEIARLEAEGFVYLRL